VLVSRPVGGILSTGPSRVAGWAAIHLCGLPEECPCGPTGRRRPLLGLAPGGGCHPPRSPPAMVRSYRTVSPLPVPTVRSAIGGLLSVARSVRSLRPGSRQHPALWSPDLPRRRDRSRRRGRPGHCTRTGTVFRDGPARGEIPGGSCGIIPHQRRAPLLRQEIADEDPSGPVGIRVLDLRASLSVLSALHAMSDTAGPTAFLPLRPAPETRSANPPSLTPPRRAAPCPSPPSRGFSS